MHQGKYIFAQVVRFISRYDFNKCADLYVTTHHSRTLSCYDQFLALVFGQLSHRESLRDIVNCLDSQQGHLYHLGFSGRVARSTLAEANENRDWRIYRDLVKILIAQASELYKDDTVEGLDLEGAVYIVDASTIELCLPLFPWARLKTVRAGVKFHFQMALKGSIPQDFDFTNAREPDVKFMDVIEIEENAHYVFDRGYIDYKRLHTLHSAGAFFVIRAKKNMQCRRLYSHPKNKEDGILCDQTIMLSTKTGKEKYPDRLRRIKYFDKESDRSFTYLTNDFNADAKTIVLLYKYRWQIELFFKWIKQHLKIETFWGRSENAVKTQICVALCSYLLVAIAKKKLGIQRNLYEILQILNVTLLTKGQLESVLSETPLQTEELDGGKQLRIEGF